MLDVYATRDALFEGLALRAPDVLLLDLVMPGVSVEQSLALLEANYPQVKVIALTMSADAITAKHLLSAGLDGYVMKEDAFDDLVLAIEEVMQGGQFISAAIVEDIRLAPVRERKIHLTSQELAVLKSAADSNSNKEIARILNISERTVRFHMSKCFLKLKVKNRGGAIAEGLKQSLF